MTTTAALLRSSPWHAELLERMTLDIEGVRPALYDRDLLWPLDDLRRFRHRFRHMYDRPLDPERVKKMQQLLLAVLPGILAGHERFVEKVQFIASKVTDEWQGGVRVMGMIDFQSRLDLLISRIVEIAHPLRIVLFGSAARMDIGPDSDVDLFVIMPDGTQRRATAQKGVGIPFDVLVATPADILRHKDNIGLIYRSALRDGREVYAA